MINIAIDGPAGAGKSTIAKAVAKELGYIYVDTGALYRAVALFVLQRRIDPYDAVAVGKVLPLIDVELRYVDGEQRVYLCGENVSRVIRTQEVSMGASAVSAIPKVRSFLFDLQLDMAENNNVVMDGRDIGTVVLPHAQVKIFLTASAEVRARRRYDELVAKGHSADYERVLAEVIERDRNDTTRAIAPLRAAPDAVTVDTTELDRNGALEAVMEVVRAKLDR